jgi:hypothetical protein
MLGKVFAGHWWSIVGRNQFQCATSTSRTAKKFMKTTAKTTNSHAFARAIRCFVSAGSLPIAGGMAGGHH